MNLFLKGQQRKDRNFFKGIFKDLKSFHCHFLRTYFLLHLVLQYWVNKENFQKDNENYNRGLLVNIFFIPSDPQFSF